MDKKYLCFCGLYCENCAVLAKIHPAAKKLHAEMIDAGFDEIIGFFPGGGGFWSFLDNMAKNGLCTDCKSGGGDPDCGVRKCAREKNVETCALCGEYPCGRFDDRSSGFFRNYPTLKADNALLKEKGFAEWGALQDRRRSEDFTYGADRKQRASLKSSSTEEQHA